MLFSWWWWSFWKSLPILRDWLWDNGVSVLALELCLGQLVYWWSVSQLFVRTSGPSKHIILISWFFFLLYSTLQCYLSFVLSLISLFVHSALKLMRIVKLINFIWKLSLLVCFVIFQNVYSNKQFTNDQRSWMFFQRLWYEWAYKNRFEWNQWGFKNNRSIFVSSVWQTRYSLS